MVEGVAEEGWVEENERTQGSSGERIGNEDQTKRESETSDSKYGRAVELQLRRLCHNHGRAVEEDLGSIKVRVGEKGSGVSGVANAPESREPRKDCICRQWNIDEDERIEAIDDCRINGGGGEPNDKYPD